MLRGSEIVKWFYGDRITYKRQKAGNLVLGILTLLCFSKTIWQVDYKVSCWPSSHKIATPSPKGKVGYGIHIAVKKVTYVSLNNYMHRQNPDHIHNFPYCISDLAQKKISKFLKVTKTLKIFRTIKKYQTWKFKSNSKLRLMDLQPVLGFKSNITGNQEKRFWKACSLILNICISTDFQFVLPPPSVVDPTFSLFLKLQCPQASVCNRNKGTLISTYKNLRSWRVSLTTQGILALSCLRCWGTSCLCWFRVPWFSAMA